MKLTAGEGQFVTVPDHMVDHYLSRGWSKVEKPKSSAPAQDAPTESKPRRGRRKVSGESGVDAAE